MPTLRSTADFISALQGKITPTDERAVRTEVTTAIQKAGGAPEVVQQAQREITNALEPRGGSSLPEYGGSLFTTIVKGGALGLGALLVILIVKD